MNKLNVKADELSAVIEAQLSKYNQEVNDQLADAVDKSITKLVKITKQTAPRGKRNGRFAENITADKLHKRIKSAVIGKKLKAFLLKLLPGFLKKDKTK